MDIFRQTDDGGQKTLLVDVVRDDSFDAKFPAFFRHWKSAIKNAIQQEEATAAVVVVVAVAVVVSYN